MDEQTGPNKAVIAIIVIVLIAAAAAGALLLGRQEDSSSEQTVGVTDTTQTTESTTDSTGDAISDDTYKDGTYKATGNYQTPGGSESVDVELTVASGKVTAANVKQNATSGEAEQYQGQFVSGYKSQVVGKSLADLDLDRIAGSSLTPSGFNNAVDEIKEQAKA